MLRAFRRPSRSWPPLAFPDRYIVSSATGQVRMNFACMDEAPTAYGSAGSESGAFFYFTEWSTAGVDFGYATGPSSRAHRSLRCAHVRG